jgi:hypothetical protein
MDLGTVLVGVAAVISSSTAAVAAIAAHRAVGHVAEDISTPADKPPLGELVVSVSDDVATINGISAGGLLERTEGRRVGEIPKEERTVAEQGYVDNLEKGGRGL